MSGLPEGWSKLTLGGAVEAGAPIIYGILQPGPDVPGGVPYVRPTEIQNGEIDLRNLRRTSAAIADRYRRASLQADDIILSIVGTIGKVAVVPSALSGGNITQSSCRLRAEKGLVEVPFLAAFLKAPQATDQFGELSLGTAVPRLNLEDVRRIDLPLPPLAEQRRIGAKLDTLTARTARARADLDRIPALAGHFRDAVLEQAFQGRLNGDPGGWSPMTLAELGKWASGGTPKSGRADYYGGDIPWIRSGDLRDGPVTRHAVTISDEGLANSSAKWMPAGTVLLAMYGATIGRVGLATYPVTTNQAVACLRCDSSLVSPEFAFWLLRSLKPSFVKAGQGGAQPNISQTIIKSWPVLIPPLDQQAEIIRRLEGALAEIDRLTTEAAAARRLLDRLDQAILAKAFRGELVPQDPVDEPASVLLERTRAERATAPKPRRRQRAAA